MRTSERFRYHNFHKDLDVDAFEEAIGFDTDREGVNKRGEAEDIGHCPDPWQLHKNGDTTGKFALNRDKRLYNCWVCGGGTLLDLTMAVKGWTEQQAEDWLFQFTAPSEVSDTDFLSEIDAIFYEEQRAKPVMPYYNPHVLDRWTTELVHLDGWLNDRGISDEVAVRAHIGFQADAMRMPHVKDAKGGTKPYTGPCAYLPHFWGERLVGWQQRWLDEDRPKWVAKYTNTSGFPKLETIYGYDDVYLAGRPIVVCESVTTALFLKSLGYPAVATFGGSVSDEQMRLLRFCQQGVVLAPDNDGPGYKWLDYTEEERRLRKFDRTVLAHYLSRYIPVKVIDPIGEYNSGNDLGDLLSEGRPFAAAVVKVLYEEAEYY